MAAAAIPYLPPFGADRLAERACPSLDIQSKTGWDFGEQPAGIDEVQHGRPKWPRPL